MLLSRCQAVLEARTRDELRREVVKFAQNLEFNTVSATTIFDRFSRPTNFVTVDNSPPAFRDRLESVERNARDPVMQHCKTSGCPIIWDQSTYVKVNLGEHWEEQAAFGYRSGMALALHLPEGKHFLLGVDLDGQLTGEPHRLRGLVADLQLFTAYAQETAFRLLLPRPRELVENASRLTSREREALRWTLEGKTAWEIGEVFNISEAWAVSELCSAMNKLRCVTKLQAALKAQRLGLLR